LTWVVSSAVSPFFRASGLSPGQPSLACRCRPTPASPTPRSSDLTVVPGVADVMTTVHEPVPPEVVQLDGPTKLPGPLTLLKLITVPSGAFVKPAPIGDTLTCPVNV